MLSGKKRRWCVLPLVAILSIATAFLASGCLWGVVTDTETGIHLGGAKVRVLDSEGQGFEATTDSNGKYVFDVKSGPVPAVGPARFAIWLPGCDTAKIWYDRVILYDDYPWELTRRNTGRFSTSVRRAPCRPRPPMSPGIGTGPLRPLRGVPSCPDRCG
jgi:hypothetical protein